MNYSNQDFRHYPRRDNRPAWFMGAVSFVVLSTLLGYIGERDAQIKRELLAAERASAINLKACPPPGTDGLETVWIVATVTADGKLVGKPTCGRVTGSMRAAPKKAKTVFAEAGESDDRPR